MNQVAAFEPEIEYLFAGWRFRPGRWELMGPGGDAVVLSHSELQLLLALAQRPGRVLSRDRLLELTRGSMAATYDRVIDVHLCRLRRKLKAVDPDAPALFRTLVGAGYMLNAPVERRVGD